MTDPGATSGLSPFGGHAANVLTPPFHPTPDQADAARRYVTAHALDADDARQLLAALGLLP